MIGLQQVLALSASVVLGTSIPFVPTGEMVSGAAALVGGSLPSVLVVFGVAWICSLIGDTILLLEVGLFRRRLRGWLDRRTFGARVARAQEGLADQAFRVMLTARLIPGGRAPVIVALGLNRFDVRRFLAIDAVACAVWAAIFATIGSIGGSLTGNPVWAMVIAVAIAVSLGVVLPRLVRLARRWLRPPAAPRSAQDTIAIATLRSV